MKGTFAIATYHDKIKVKWKINRGVNRKEKERKRTKSEQDSKKNKDEVSPSSTKQSLINTVKYILMNYIVIIILYFFE